MSTSGYDFGKYNKKHHSDSVQRDSVQRNSRRDYKKENKELRNQIYKLKEQIKELDQSEQSVQNKQLVIPNFFWLEIKNELQKNCQSSDFKSIWNQIKPQNQGGKGNERPYRNISEFTLMLFIEKLKQVNGMTNRLSL